jgi:hypothetical protein
MKKFPLFFLFLIFSLVLSSITIFPIHKTEAINPIQLVWGMTKSYNTNFPTGYSSTVGDLLILEINTFNYTSPTPTVISVTQTNVTWQYDTNSVYSWVHYGGVSNEMDLEIWSGICNYTGATGNVIISLNYGVNSNWGLFQCEIAEYSGFNVGSSSTDLIESWTISHGTSTNGQMIFTGIASTTTNNDLIIGSIGSLGSGSLGITPTLNNYGLNSTQCFISGWFYYTNLDFLYNMTNTTGNQQTGTTPQIAGAYPYIGLIICFKQSTFSFTVLNGEYYNPYPVLFSGGGTTNPTNGTYYNYTINSNVVIQAYPTNNSFQFVYWKINVSGSTIFNMSNPFTFNMISNISVEPFFILENTTLIINSAIGGVTNPINGTYTNYTYNSNVTIFETPNTGYHFGYWLINGYSQNSTNSTSGMITFNITQNTVVQPIFNLNFGFSYVINPSPEIYNQNIYNSSLYNYDYPTFKLNGVYDDLWLRQGNEQYYTFTGTISGIFNLTGNFDVLSGDLMAQDSLIPPVLVGNLYYPNTGFMSRVYFQPFNGMNSSFASFSFVFSPRNSAPQFGSGMNMYEDIIIDFFSSNGTVGTGYNYLYLHITWKWFPPMPTSVAVVNSQSFIIAVFLLGIPFAVCIIFLWKLIKFYSVIVGLCTDFGIIWFSNGLIPLWVLFIIGGIIVFFIYMKISNKTGGRI